MRLSIGAAVSMGSEQHCSSSLAHSLQKSTMAVRAFTMQFCIRLFTLERTFLSRLWPGQLIGRQICLSLDSMIVYTTKDSAPCFIISDGKRHQIRQIKIHLKHSASIMLHALVQGLFYLAAAVSWLKLKLLWHLVAMTAVTKATAALE